MMSASPARGLGHCRKRIAIRMLDGRLMTSSIRMAIV